MNNIERMEDAVSATPEHDAASGNQQVLLDLIKAASTSVVLNPEACVTVMPPSAFEEIQIQSEFFRSYSKDMTDIEKSALLIDTVCEATMACVPGIDTPEDAGRLVNLSGGLSGDLARAVLLQVGIGIGDGGDTVEGDAGNA